MAGDILVVQPPFLFSPEQPILVNATTLTAEEAGLAAVAGSAARRGPGYMTGVCLVLYAAAAASLGNVVQVVLRTVLYCTVLYCNCGAGGADENQPRGHQQPPDCLPR